MPYYIQNGNHPHYDTANVPKRKKSAFIQDNRNKVTIGRRCSIINDGIKRVYEITLTVSQYKEYRLTGALPIQLSNNDLRFLANNITPDEYSATKVKPSTPIINKPKVRDADTIISKAELIVWRYGTIQKQVTIVKEAYSKLDTAYIIIDKLKNLGIIETDKGIVLPNYNADVYKLCLELF